MHHTQSLSVRLPAPLVARLRAFAAQMKCSHSSAMRIVMARGLKAYENEAGDDRVDHERFLDPPKEKAGRFVYFIRDDKADAIKIGFCKGDPKRRLRALQISTSTPLKLLFAIPGGQKREASMHRRFASIRIRGEWFHAHESLIEFIEEAKKRSRKKDRPVTDGEQPSE